MKITIKKRWRYAFYLLLIVLYVTGAAMPQKAYAADADTDGESVGFSVQALLPQNQRDSSESYFDLRVRAEQTQDLQVQLNNSTDKTLYIKVEAISASTNSNGLIDYTTPGVEDDSLQIGFADIATPNKDIYAVDPYSSVTATIHLVMPSDEFDGIVLGGLSFSRQADVTQDEDAAESTGIQIKNSYRYALGVVLSESDDEVAPDFEAVGATPKLVQSRASVLSAIRNTKAAILKDATLDVSITKKGETDPIKTAHADDISIAPNSVFSYNFLWNGAIKPGSYVSRETLTAQDGSSWTFDMPFEVSGSIAASINNGSVEVDHVVPWWVWALMVLLVVVILALIAVLVAHRKAVRGEREKG